ncbi:hypothetical protein SAMN04244553_2584 [Nocardia amikacinitolerans]|uniref:Uncharacterized protein n=1 Tax=Nocardia amikacinitolerans TaxID=756689 RepID=A0A285LAE3_9NOCA|nr:hypothetical protein [Nocardia amikacinitolerans]SNY81007.1 hypothetical protein SAMN04244553_2584 [Nocardia amikacinitolerans]
MSSAAASPLPGEPDVHLSVFLHGVRMDFAACLTAALVFVAEHRDRHYLDAVTVDTNAAGHPRLPNERLYLEP